MEAIQSKDRFTYANYEKWPDDVRVEIIEGEIYDMSPAPMLTHQEIAGELFGQLREFLKGHTCKAYFAPVDVILKTSKAGDTIVQPDVVVVCDKEKLNDKNIAGAPDMLIEVLSPSTSRKDKVIKLNIYRQAGVREYWIVDPEDQTVLVNVLKDGEYTIKTYDSDGIVPVSILDGCEISLKSVFAQ